MSETIDTSSFLRESLHGYMVLKLTIRAQDGHANLPDINQGAVLAAILAFEAHMQSAIPDETPILNVPEQLLDDALEAGISAGASHARSESDRRSQRLIDGGDDAETD